MPIAARTHAPRELSRATRGGEAEEWRDEYGERHEEDGGDGSVWELQRDAHQEDGPDQIDELQEEEERSRGGEERMVFEGADADHLDGGGGWEG